MRVQLERSYRSKNGNTTFVYVVTGSASDLEAFKAAQGEFYREDDKGRPLWFTTRCIGQLGTQVITTNGNVVPDMSQFDQAASLAAQYGGNFGAELAKAAASQLLGKKPPVAADPSANDVPPSDDLNDL